MIYVSSGGQIMIEPGRASLDAIEKVVLQETLRAHGGNKKDAAQSLGVSRSAFYAKLKRFGLWTPRCSTCGGRGHQAEHHETAQLPAGASPAATPDPDSAGGDVTSPGAAS